MEIRVYGDQICVLFVCSELKARDSERVVLLVFMF